MEKTVAGLVVYLMAATLFLIDGHSVGDLGFWNETDGWRFPARIFVMVTIISFPARMIFYLGKHHGQQMLEGDRNGHT